MSQITSAAGLDSAVRGSTQANQFSEMQSEDFIRVIFTELTNQDPFAPNDTSALLEQLNSLRSIESDIDITNKLKALVTENQLAAASNMIGKFVTGLTDDANRVSGRVVAVGREGDKVSVELDNGWRVPVSSVESILDATPAAG